MKLWRQKMLATQVCADEIQYTMIFNLNDTQTVKSVAHKVTLAGCDCSISFPLVITGRFPPPVPYLSDKKRFCVFTTSKAVRETGGGLELLTDLTTPDYMVCGKGVKRNQGLPRPWTKQKPGSGINGGAINSNP